MVHRSAANALSDCINSDHVDFLKWTPSLTNVDLIWSDLNIDAIWKCLTIKNTNPNTEFNKTNTGRFKYAATSRKWISKLIFWLFMKNLPLQCSFYSNLTYLEQVIKKTQQHNNQIFKWTADPNTLITITTTTENKFKQITIILVITTNVISLN